MPFSVCYYHLLWATKNREPLITPDVELVIISAITQKSVALHCPIQAINSVADHIHVAVSISTTLSVADWARNIKGFSAHEVNSMFPDRSSSFRWQQGYGVLTFGVKTLPFIVVYIAHQKENHRQNLLEMYLERTEDE
jgi:putative transposase